MRILQRNLLYCGAFVGIMVAPAYATVSISALSPSVRSPQLIGTSITWTATATGTAVGTLGFQFNVAAPGQPLSMIKDFNVGKARLGSWTSLPFVWVPTGVEGVYSIQVVIKDFTSGETASKTVKFQITPLVTGSTPVVVPTSNPMIALFSTPACN